MFDYLNNPLSPPPTYSPLGQALNTSLPAQHSQLYASLLGQQPRGITQGSPEQEAANAAAFRAQLAKALFAGMGGGQQAQQNPNGMGAAVQGFTGAIAPMLGQLLMRNSSPLGASVSPAGMYGMVS